MQLYPHHWRNGVQSALLLAAMGLVWALLGWSLAGGAGMLLMALGGVISVVTTVRLAPRVMLAMYRARPLSPGQVPGLHALLVELCRRAGLATVPTLFHAPSRLLNAFSVGSGGQTAIMLSDGLLRALSRRELAGVLAHELSHIRHNDTWVMALADLVSRMTHFLSLFGQLLLLVNLPLVLLTEYHIPWLTVLLLLLAPAVTALLQLALSRQREYDADYSAVEITGDPVGLAAALQRLEQMQGNWFEHIFLPGRRVPEPSMLRTHPPTGERVQRLLAMAESINPVTATGREDVVEMMLQDLPSVTRRPRRNIFGLWY